MEIRELGIISLILGIIGLFSFFVLGIFVSLPLGIIAVATGYKPKKQGNKNGKYGLILGSITIALSIMLLAFAVGNNALNKALSLVLILF